MLTIKTKRLMMREFNGTDTDAMVAVLCDPDVMRFSDQGPHSRAFVRTWIARQIAAYEHTGGLDRWAIIERATDECVGYAALTRDPERCGPAEAEIGFRLSRRCWGRGYATEAAEAVVDYGFARLELDRIVAIVDPHNTASMRVIEKLGMKYVREISFPAYSYPDRLYALTNRSAPRIK